MRKTAIMILMILCCIGWTVSAAATSAPSIQCDANISGDSSCTVNLTVTVIYTDSEASPVFPIPKGAEDVTLNGENATMFAAGNSRMVSLKSITGGNAGTYQFNIRYRVNTVVTTTETEAMQLNLQLLAGFPYPIDQFSATLTLPNSFETTPQLISGYYQQDISGKYQVSHKDNQITVSNLRQLKDNETLFLQMETDGSLFPKTEQTARVLGIMDLVIVIVVLLAAGYYLLTMRPTLRRYASRASAPDSVTAGETGLWYVGSGVDLTMLVVTWAQLGYIRIQVEESGRVLLHKRMDMGNERSAYENKCYRKLFGTRRIVDGTGQRYAELCLQMAKKSPRLKDVYRSKNGNPYVFRLLCTLSATLSGVALAGALAPYSVFLRIVLAVLTTVLAFLIQNGTRYLPLRHRTPLKVGLIAAGVWMILSFIAGEWIAVAAQILIQSIVGLALAFGGRRTELGQQALYQIAGLRRHMRRVGKQDLQRLLKGNPNYFYELAPYALALGMDKTFARRFGRLRMVECTYLIRSRNGLMTASEWAALLRTTVNTLDARSKRLFWEKLTHRR